MRISSIFGLLALVTVAAGQNGPVAAVAQKRAGVPPHIPPVGMAVEGGDLAELGSGVAALGAEIGGLREKLSGNARLLALLPDVEVYHKAVGWSLADKTFYSPKEIAFAKHLLEAGRERAGQLREGKTPWLEAKGNIIRGYRSKIDGSIQPYGLFVPPDLDTSKPVPLMVWLLGRGEKRTELAFMAEREGGSPPVLPKGTLVVIPYGRFCNATKFAGETDVMEALAAARRQYAVDPLRIAVAGFSMGGGSTWHLAAHYPGLWCAASPGAGFAETPVFTKALAPGKEERPPWEQTLWRQYEATGISGNLFNVPTLAYAGEIDAQKEASDLMEAAMAREGLKLERFIGPGTAHQYHPETKAALTGRLEELIAKGRPKVPSEIHFSTYTLRYPGSAWVRVEGMGKHWERAEVKAKLSADNKVVAETANVTAIRFTGIKPTAVTLDGQAVALEGPPDDMHFVRADGVWRSSAPGGVIHKGPGLTGPVDDAFMDAFVFVRPTGKPLNPVVGSWVESERSHAMQLWRDVFRGEVQVVDDKALSAEDIATKNLVLWGDPSSNSVMAKILTGIPLGWDSEKIRFRGQSYGAADHAMILVFPNPLNPERYVVLNSGIDFRDDGYGNNALQTPKLPDWAVVDLTEKAGARWPGKIEKAGFFDEFWRW